MSAPRSQHGGVSATATWSRRCGRVARWLVPGAILALVPKCPACLAAYIAMGTGLGLSLPVATQLRAGLIIGCIAALGFLAVRFVRGAVQLGQSPRRGV